MDPEKNLKDLNLKMLKIDQYTVLCDASKWRLGTTAVVPGLPPSALDAVIPARHSLECPYVTRGLGVVDRILGVCPVTRSSRHLTSHLFHSYISTTHSLRPQACVISFSVSQATSLGF